MKIKELMTPLSEYSTLGTDAKLSDVIVSLTESKHRDILIVDENGDLKGILTMTDILRALEPSYKKLDTHDRYKATLTSRYVGDVFKEFGLWTSSLSELCKKGCTTSVVDIMHVPDITDYLNEDDELEDALHHYVVGTQQPLIIRKNGEITGILRLVNVFDEIKKRMIACACEQ